MSLEKALSKVMKENIRFRLGLSDAEIAESVADISGKSYQEVMDWITRLGYDAVTLYGFADVKPEESK